MNDTATANNFPATIDQKKDLAHLNELVAEITGLKEGYKDLIIEGPDDKDGYERVRAAIAVLRPKRTGLEAERKSVVKPYNDTVKLINGEYEKITTLIQEGPGGELELKEKKEAIDDIVKQQEEEKKRQEEAKINNRINELIAAGMVFDGNWYAIGDKNSGIAEMTLGIADIRTMSDNQFANTLQMVDDKSQKIVAEKKRLEDIAAKEKADKEAADKAEREEFDRKKKEFDDQQAAFKKQQDDLKAQQDKLDADKRDAELKERQAEQNRINGIIRHRSAVLAGMELKYNENNGSFDYNGEVLIADGATIAEHEDVEWLELLEKLRALISSKKFAAEEFLKKKAEEEKQRLELQEKERLAGLSDKQKIQEYCDKLLAIQVPFPLKTKTWKAVAGWIRDHIADNRPA